MCTCKCAYVLICYPSHQGVSSDWVVWHSVYYWSCATLSRNSVLGVLGLALHPKMGLYHYIIHLISWVLGLALHPKMGLYHYIIHLISIHCVCHRASLKTCVCIKKVHCTVTSLIFRDLISYTVHVIYMYMYIVHVHVHTCIISLSYM